MGRAVEKFISTKEVCDCTGLTRHQIETARRNGMPFYKIGKRIVRFRLSEVQTWIRERRHCA